MSDPSPRSANGLWAAVRDLLHLKAPNTLRESIEEAIDEHHGEIADPGDLDQDERVMLRNMLRLSEQQATDAAVPRSDIIAIPHKSDFREVVAIFHEAGHSRLPVYSGDLDTILGMLHIKDIYAVVAERFGKPKPTANLPMIDELLRPVLFVPPSMPLVDLLTEMRRKRTHMALVVDEYGGTDGLITIEDIVEEIVGEIEDEHDDEEVALTHRLPDGRIEVDARIDLDDLADTVGINFADNEMRQEVDTLGGLSVMIAGRVPQTGDIIQHPNGWKIEVSASDGQRVEKLVLHPPVIPEVIEP